MGFAGKQNGGGDGAKAIDGAVAVFLAEMRNVAVGRDDEQFAAYLGYVAEFGERHTAIAVNIGYTLGADIIDIGYVRSEYHVGSRAHLLCAEASNNFFVRVVDEHRQDAEPDECFAEAILAHQKKPASVVVGEPVDYRPVVLFIPNGVAAGEVGKTLPEQIFGIGDTDKDMCRFGRITRIAEIDGVVGIIDSVHHKSLE